MSDAGHQEQTHPVILFAAEFLRHSVVVIDGVSRRDQLIVPAVIQQQLAMPAEEFLEVRIGRVERPAIQFVSEIDVAEDDTEAARYGRRRLPCHLEQLIELIAANRRKNERTESLLIGFGPPVNEQ